MFKTLVVERDGRLAVCVVPVTDDLDLRSLGKRAQLADQTSARRTSSH